MRGSNFILIRQILDNSLSMWEKGIHPQANSVYSYYTISMQILARGSRACFPGKVEKNRRAEIEFGGTLGI